VRRATLRSGRLIETCRRPESGNGTLEIMGRGEFFHIMPRNDEAACLAIHMAEARFSGDHIIEAAGACGAKA
jgi:hypothetical protein